MSLAAWIPSSFRFFSISLLRAMAARSSADEAQPMAMARTAWLATRGSAVPLACSRPVVARRWRRARASERTRAPCRRVRAPAPAQGSTPHVPGGQVQAYRREVGGRGRGRGASWSRWRRGVCPRTNDGPRRLGALRPVRRLANRRLRRAPGRRRTPAARCLPDTLITPYVNLGIGRLFSL